MHIIKLAVISRLDPDQVGNRAKCSGSNFERANVLLDPVDLWDDARSLSSGDSITDHSSGHTQAHYKPVSKQASYTGVPVTPRDYASVIKLVLARLISDELLEKVDSVSNLSVAASVTRDLV